MKKEKEGEIQFNREKMNEVRRTGAGYKEYGVSVSSLDVDWT